VVHARPDTPLSAELLLRPTTNHPDLTTVLTPGMQRTIHLTLQRDEHGRPVDALYVHGDAPRDQAPSSSLTVTGQPTNAGVPRRAKSLSRKRAMCGSNRSCAHSAGSSSANQRT
jgi:hypothetical protein